MSKYRKNPVPVPVPTPVTQPFWDATKDHRLLLQKCGNGHVFYYARTHCPECLTNEVNWVEASGRGKLYSYTVARRPQSPEFAEDLPYIIAAITLEEGPRMTSLLVEADPDNVVIDGPVEVAWDDLDGLSMPYFRPVKA
ncbi:MAG: Zn-ribbon domain-containing OB-fold protein [Dehalococcoidia bacterium]|nr:Zn-ribbon domain-containing OB-fold protein [Dehalococcoidia bacterium]